jgi:hypothetical protein
MNWVALPMMATEKPFVKNQFLVAPEYQGYLTSLVRLA